MEQLACSERRPNLWELERALDALPNRLPPLSTVDNETLLLKARRLVAADDWGGLYLTELGQKVFDETKQLATSLEGRSQ